MSLDGPLKTRIARLWDSAGRAANRPSCLTILYYHAVPGELSQAFEEQMSVLRRSANVVAADYAGPFDSPRPYVAVTFDDAFRSVAEHALPALLKHSIPATIFVPTGWLGRRPGWAMETSEDQNEVVMTRAELAALPQEIAIGSHSVSHPRLSKVSDVQLAAELRESKSNLEDWFGRAVNTLAFPYGDHDERVIDACTAAGYRQVYTVMPERIRTPLNRVARGRTSVEPSDSLSLFVLKMRGAFDWMPLASRVKQMIKRR